MTRQQTLRATLAWSFDLLDADEQMLLRRLAVFAGSFGLEAAEDVCAEEPLQRSEAVALLGRLIDKSLVQVEEGPGDRRYRLLETVRQYAAERLEEAGERDAFAAPPPRLVRRAGRERPDARPAICRRATVCGGWIWSATTSAPPSPRRSADDPQVGLRLAVAPLALLADARLPRRGVPLARRGAGGGARAHRGSRPRPARRLPRRPAPRRPRAASTSSAPRASRSSRELDDHAGMFDAVEVSTGLQRDRQRRGGHRGAAGASTRRWSSTTCRAARPPRGRRTRAASPPGSGASTRGRAQQLGGALERAGELVAESRPALWPLSYGLISVEPELGYPLFLQEDTVIVGSPRGRRRGRRLHPRQPGRGRSGRGRLRPGG